MVSTDCYRNGFLDLLQVEYHLKIPKLEPVPSATPDVQLLAEDLNLHTHEHVHSQLEEVQVLVRIVCLIF
jgi:hypothetical protein